MAVLLTALTGSLALGGCGLGTSTSQAFAPSTQSGNALSGQAHGGQQPISGATVQLYMVSTAGYGTPATSLNALDINSNPVTTDSNGHFTIASHDTADCVAGNEVYILMSGGNPGLGGGSNSAATLMATLGTCADLAAWSTFINMNEITTVASAWTLASFMTNATSVGTSSTNTTGLAAAFATASNLVDLRSGLVSGPSLPAGTILPTARLITLANILGSCLNSPGPSSPACSTLFANAGPVPNAAADTASAAVLIAQNPSVNVASLFSLATPNVAFSGGETVQPNDFIMSITYTGGGMNAPQGITVDGSGNVWVANAGNNTVTELSSTGAPVAGSPYSGFSVPYAIAIDSTGNAWVANNGNSTLAEISGNTVTTYSPAGLNAPTSIAIDNMGTLWLNNSGPSANSVSAVSSAGVAMPGSPYSVAGVTAPVALAITPQ
jgi:hypothetical protein